MSRYRRANVPGGTFFLTLVTYRRRPIFDDSLARGALHDAIHAAGTARPFALLQMVLLPDHLHLLLRLPSDDSDYSTRIASIKAGFTQRWLGEGGRGLKPTLPPTLHPASASRRRQRYRDVWQKRFWEHCVRDPDDLARCEAYCWYNPVKHGHARCPHDWPWSTFHREVERGNMRKDWWCVCDGVKPEVALPTLDGAEAEEQDVG